MDAEHVGMSARWFSLTLVKGDEGVEAGEKGADCALLTLGRNSGLYLSKDSDSKSWLGRLS